MWINKVSIKNFRNYEIEIVDLNKNVNIFYGENAQGKTNIIEAIYFCAIGRSFRTNKEKELVMDNKDGFEIVIEYDKQDRNGKIKIDFYDNKNIFVNGIKIKKLSELFGKLNVVIFNPDDINILKGSPQNRRKFIDIMISQIRPNYIHILNLYAKALEQRNSYLKSIKENNTNIDMLDIWDEKISEYAIKVYEYRKEFIEKINKKIVEIHKEITDNREQIDLEYISSCSSQIEYLKVLKERRKLDILKGFTTKGIHRDDFMIYINGKELNIYGSQGQHRTGILSLKIAELNIIKEEVGEFPILLLDDFMSELDERRRKNLIEKVEKSQVIITCTEKFDIENRDNLIYNVVNGKTFKEIQ